MTSINNLYSARVMDHFLHPRNIGELPDANGVATVGNKVCVLPETLILANSEVVQIKDIAEGQKVLGHDGYFHQVVNTHKRKYSGNLYIIRTHNLGGTVLTPDHHVLALKTSPFSHKLDSFQKNKVFVDWLNASQLEKGDTLLYPVIKEVANKSSFDTGVVKRKWDFRSIDLPKNTIIDNNFLRLVGYYLAEGYLCTRVGVKMLGFVFGSNEQTFIRDVIFLMKKFFNFNPSDIRKAHNSTNIIYYRSQLVDLFKNLFGKGAAEKHLPHWMLILPLEKQNALICGLWRGDGYISDRRKVAKFVTISQQLAYQLRSLLLRQKIISSFLTTSAKGIHKKSYSIYVKEDSSLKKLAAIVGKNVHYPVNKKSPHKTWFDENYYYSPISKIEKIRYEGDVYNLEVEGSASYVSESATLHNCGDVMKMFLKIGKKEGQEVIEDAKFQTLGCGAAIATSSIATEMIKGKPVSEALKLTKQAIMEALGGLPPAKHHCSVLAAEAVKKAIEDYKNKKLT